MKIAIAQLNFKIAAFEDNFCRIRKAVDQARDLGVDLVVFSELATTGYPPCDLLECGDFIEQNLEQLDRIAALSDDRLAIIVGFVDRNPSEEGKALYNAAALCFEGGVTGRYHKSLLPTYDVFDEARYFEPGGKAQPLELNGIPIGITICEDAWTDPDLWERRLYSRDPVCELVSAGARLLINISASPFSLGKDEKRRAVVSHAAAEHGVAYVYVNQVGANDELVFDGHSLVCNDVGEIVSRARDFEEDLLVVDCSLDDEKSVTEAVSENPMGYVSVCEEEAAFRALVLGLKDYLGKTGFEHVLLGLSGGIDSALTAAVAVEAVGADRVCAVAMPTRYSSDGSLNDATKLAENLGIEMLAIPIDPIFQSFLDTMEPSFQGMQPGVTEENIQARVRGTVLMALSNKKGGLLLATGNKSELAVGYCTLYGDMCGGLAVIGDVPKTLVYRISKWLNRDQEVIPTEIITKAPSAELRPDQTDQDSLPEYDLLDAVVEAYVEQHLSVEEMIGNGLSEQVVRAVVHLIDANEHKRRQAPPAIRITTKAFGLGRRFPIVADYRALHRE
ncbi:MAG: NAD+ synthase [bacterium]|nr:NAD+ synthase [bacterium]